METAANKTVKGGFIKGKVVTSGCCGEAAAETSCCPAPAGTSQTGSTSCCGAADHSHPEHKHAEHTHASDAKSACCGGGCG